MPKQQHILEHIKTQAQNIFPKVVAIRRQIHQYPELAFEEYQTAKLVADFLKELGLQVQEGVAKTGVVALLKGAKPGRVIALRADMDALPIQEANPVEYASCINGKMHACGHDAHTASLLGCAAILTTLKDELPGQVKFIFQPSEEKEPGGASVMIQEGVLKNPAPQAIIAQHVASYLPVGKIGIRAGEYMASADEIRIVIRGKGGHGAQPHTCIDPIVIAAQIIVTLQQLVSRVADPRIPTVLTFGKIEAQGATNVIPDTAYLEGTFRTFDEKWRTQAHQWIQKTVKGIAESLGAEVNIQLQKGYPVLYNDVLLTQQIRENIAFYVGEENIEELPIWMASEDFAFYTHHIPGCFYRLGTRNESKGIVHPVHTPYFNIDEDALRISTGLMAWLTYCYLISHSS
ncbi:MAG: M20 family metallopeptidase [Bacteroidia bacterium]|nr:M20 family metallopeptidase [Bacteroidia bacterium]